MRGAEGTEEVRLRQERAEPHFWGKSGVRFRLTGTDLEAIMPCEISQSLKDRHWRTPLVRDGEHSHSQSWKELLGAGAGERKWGVRVSWVEVQFGMMKTLWRWTEVAGAEQGIYLLPLKRASWYQLYVHYTTIQKK